MNENNEIKIGKTDTDIDNLILLVRAMQNRKDNADIFADVAAKFMKFPTEEFKKLLIRAADNLIFGESSVRKCVSFLGTQYSNPA